MSSFTPPFWLRNPHLLTIASATFPLGRMLDQTACIPDFVNVSHHAHIVVYCHLQPDYKTRPTFILVHGLEGSAHSFYITGLTQQAFATKNNVVRVNLRSCGEGLLLSPGLYHAGQSEDLLKLLAFLTHEKQLGQFFLIGFSLGGNMVLKAATELNPKESDLRGVCAVAPSIDLSRCVNALDTGLNQLYAKRFLRSMKRKILLKSRHFDTSHLSRIRFIRQFDDFYTAKDAGYLDASHYYAEASALSKIRNITVPTQIIASEDDPFVPFEQFSGIETESVQLHATKYGGHVGFIPELTPLLKPKKPLSCWLSKRILRFANDHTISL